MRQKSTPLYRTLLLTLAMLVIAAAAALASVPRAPMGLRYFIVSNQGQPSIYLEWANGDSTRQTTFPYHVYQATSSGGALNFSQVATVPDSGSHGFYMTSPGPGTYTFYVTSFNNDGESAGSNRVTVTLPSVLVSFAAYSINFQAKFGEPTGFTSQAQVSGNDSTLTYELVNALPGMTIDARTGVFSWIPDRVGPVSFAVRAYLASQPTAEAFQKVVINVEASAVCAKIQGTVRYSNGDVVREGFVQAWPKDSLRGEVQVAAIHEGSYSLAVADSIFYTVQLTGGTDYAPQSAPQPVILGCGGTARVDFNVTKLVLAAYDSVMGQVRRRPDGSPVMAIVTAVDSNGHVLGMARTDQNGLYYLVFRGGTSYYVHAEPLDSSLRDQYFNHSATLAGAILFSSPGSRTSIDFDLDARVVYQNSISGTLIGQNNEMLDGMVTVYSIARRDGRLVIEYSTDAFARGGNFSVANLPPGTYILFGQSFDSTGWVPGYYREHHKAELRWEDATQLTIDANTALTGIEIKLDKASGKKGHGRIRGVITGEDGTTKHNGNSAQGAKPVAGAMVFAIDAEGLVDGYANTDQSGAYEIGSLAAGVYTIQVDRVGYKGSQIVVNVAEDGTVGDAPVTLQPAESVSGVPVTGTSIATMTAYPNPARNTVTLGFNAPRGEAIVKMTNSAGFEVLSQRVATIDGTNTVALETGSLGGGLYFVTVTSGRGVMSIPVTIVR